MLGQTEDGLEKRRQVLEVMLKDIHHERGIDPRVFMDQDIAKPRHPYHRVPGGGFEDSRLTQNLERLGIGCRYAKPSVGDHVAGNIRTCFDGQLKRAFDDALCLPISSILFDGKPLSKNKLSGDIPKRHKEP